MPTLYPLQRYDAQTIASRRACLFYEPGCGKTATALAAANLFATSDSYQWGVVAPRNMLKGEDSWEDAARTWTPAKKNVYLTHYEALTRPEVRAALKKSRFLIFDEVQEAANARTQTFALCLEVASVVNVAGGRVLPTTGTPIFNGVDELATQFVLAGIMHPSQYNNFVWRYSKRVEGTFNFSEAQRIPELHTILATYTIRRTLAEMGIRLPPLYPVKWPIFLAREAGASEYNRAAADFGAWYRETHGRALPPLARFTTLRRLLSLAKAPTVAAVSRQQIFSGKKVLIFTEFRDTAEFLHKKLQGSRLIIGGDTPGQRADSIAFARSGSAGAAIIATGGALSAGANLQALDQVNIVDLPWTPAQLDQWVKRSYRGGQLRPVGLMFFLAQNDDSERHVESVLLKKTDLLIKLGLAPTGNLRQIGY